MRQPTGLSNKSIDFLIFIDDINLKNIEKALVDCQASILLAGWRCFPSTPILEFFQKGYILFTMKEPLVFSTQNTCLYVGVIALVVGFMSISSCSNLWGKSGGRGDPDCVHTYGAWVTTHAATCTVNGLEELKCTKCGHVSDTNVITASHDWNAARETVSVGVQAITCRITSCTGKKDFTFSYNMNGSGPGGGIIFFVANGEGTMIPDNGVTTIAKPLGFTMTDTGETCYYLEAAPDDLAGTYTWQSADNDITGTETGIGTGRKNTALINNHADTTPAASGCVAPYNAGSTMTDWFLPSLDELNQIYQNLVKGQTGHGFQMGLYWSSSQSDIFTNVRRQTFINGSQSGAPKYENFFVRAIRAF